VRSADPAPGAHTSFRGARLKVFRARPVTDADEADDGAAPGTVLATDREGILIACGEDALLLTEVQPAGKPRMAAGAYANGARIDVGERFGTPATPA
jgi:methionyl-tRNA formyltransferase